MTPKTVIANDRQRFLDEPVYIEISKAKPLALVLSNTFATVDRSGQRFGTEITPLIRDISHYERVQLRWMKPDGNGGLVPKYQ